MAPSIPGYGLSFRPNQRRFGPREIADTFQRLMADVLGYRRFVAHGHDWGHGPLPEQPGKRDFVMSDASQLPGGQPGSCLQAASGRAAIGASGGFATVARTR